MKDEWDEVWALVAQTEEGLAIERVGDGLRVEVPITAAWAIKHFIENEHIDTVRI